MLIQCHSCNTKYRLNLEQIPRRKTFVRCKNCGTPIYIDPTEDEQPTAGIISPQEAGIAAPAEEPDGMVQVVCPGCAARYRIAAESVQRPGVRLKCTQCGHQFAPPLAPAAAAAEEAPAASPGREMPLPDEGQMDTLFDDLRPGDVPGQEAGGFQAEPDLGSLTGEGFETEAPAPEPEQAYLDAVSFDEDGDVPARPGSVPDEQKYRLFLDPKEYQGSSGGMADHPEDKDARATAPGQSSGTGSDFGVGEVPDLDAGDVPPLPPLPVKDDTRTADDMAQVREVVPGQEARVFTEKRVLAIVAAAAVVILVATGAWGYWLASTAGDARAFTVQMGQPHQLAMANDLSGHYVNNGPSGKRLFVVMGELENRFPGDSAVRWIRIKGAAYADASQAKPLGVAYAYAGNVLEDSQLEQWELPAVKAYYGFTNGRKELNVSIPSGAKVPFQLVFSDVEGQIGRTVAQVVSYHLNGQAVFVDNP